MQCIIQGQGRARSHPEGHWWVFVRRRAAVARSPHRLLANGHDRPLARCDRLDDTLRRNQPPTVSRAEAAPAQRTVGGKTASPAAWPVLDQVTVVMPPRNKNKGGAAPRAGLNR